MFKTSPFNRKKTTGSRPFAEFYNTWLATLSTTLLPQLRLALSSFSLSPALLSLQVDGMHHHLQSYYLALDQAAAGDVAQCLHPDWRNALEKPFLWLGDLHPYLFTNLLRSFLDDQESPSSPEEEEEDGGGFLEYDSVEMKEFGHRPWHVAVAWRSPSRTLTARVDQIECGLRLMVPALAARARGAQAKLVRRVGADWGGAAAVGEAVAEEMEELVGVVVDANRLRRSVLADIVSATTVYQAALFLEAVAEFLIGFNDAKLVKEFEECEKAVN
ncbi:transcription factor-related [Striga asiatica]|uniref:Transcription factor-related n=1 Tax=Striga asiatica TaxID=4170 RepID=A0A5A7P5G7_STRAF|nr:transcription factor-related [Striga asiatica]